MNNAQVRVKFKAEHREGSPPQITASGLPVHINGQECDVVDILVTFTYALERAIQITAQHGPFFECAVEQAASTLFRVTVEAETSALLDSIAAALPSLSQECERNGYLIVNWSSFTAECPHKGGRAILYLRKIP